MPFNKLFVLLYVLFFVGSWLTDRKLLQHGGKGLYYTIAALVVILLIIYCTGGTYLYIPRWIIDHFFPFFKRMIS